jgi:hypothetical protein
MIEYVLLYFIILIPNIFRQLVYLKSFKKTRGFGFCVSYETRDMHSKGWLPWSGILEEFLWAGLWTLFWINGWQWTAFGWVSDALLDCAIAYSWSKGKRKPRLLFAGRKLKFRSFFVREILLPYLIIGQVLYLLGLNIIFFSVVSSIIGLILLIKT